jgi:hypothetical protein
MALKPATVSDLAQELATLTRQRASLDARIASLRTVLSGRPGGPGGPGSSDAGRHPSGGRGRRGPRGRRSGGSLPSHIIEALQARQKARSKDILEHVRAAGFVVGGRTPLGDRVYRELRRLVQHKLVVRGADGAYELPDRSPSVDEEQAEVELAGV